MNILFVCEYYPPHYGGAEVVFKNLAEGLAARGHTIHVVTTKLQGTPQSEIMNGVNVHRVSCFQNRYAFTFWSIPTVLRLAKKADLLQTTTFNGAPPAWLVGKLRRKPVVITVHEVWVNKWRNVTNLGKIHCALHNFLEKLIYHLSYTHYVCVSEATRQDLVALGIAPEKTTTVHNGVDYQFWQPSRFNKDTPRTALQLEQAFLCFAWGRPGPSKGFSYLLQSVPLIAKSIPSMKLLLMLGDTTTYKKEYEKLQQLLQRQDIHPHVKLIPSVPYEQLGNYIVAADCVIVPSIAEGFGYNVAEACALGVPVVASAVGSIPEVISNRFVLVPPKRPEAIAEGVLKVKEKKDTTKPLTKFLWSAALDKYEGVYRNLRH